MRNNTNFLTISVIVIMYIYQTYVTNLVVAEFLAGLYIPTAGLYVYKDVKERSKEFKGGSI